MTLRDELTLITPVRLTHPVHLEFFRATMASYYSALGEDRPRHLFAVANPDGFSQREFLEVVNHWNPGGWKDISPNTRPIAALNDLVRAVRTPYLHVVLADTCVVGSKNFLRLGVEGMNLDPELVQIRFGDDPLGCGQPCNLSAFESDGSRIFFKGMAQFPFEPLKLRDSEDVLWRYPMAAAAQRHFIGLAFWPCSYRTDFFVRVVNEAARRLPASARTLADWMAVTNRTVDFSGWCLPEKGWPAGFEFIEDKKQATLNMASYMFALGRERKPWSEFVRTSTIELKSIPPRGELTSSAGEPHTNGDGAFRDPPAAGLDHVSVPAWGEPESSTEPNHRSSRTRNSGTAAHSREKSRLLSGPAFAQDRGGRWVVRLSRNRGGR
jgi:hypothetical protein